MVTFREIPMNHAAEVYTNPAGTLAPNFIT